MPKIETRLEVHNEEKESIAKLYLYGTIREAYAWEEEDACISSKRVIKALNGLNGKAVDIHINSGGGDVFESIAIKNTIASYGGDVNLYIDGMAGSGASVIATAVKNVYMFEGAMQMIHKAWTITAGNSTQLRKTAEDLEKIDASVKSSYMNKFVGTEDELTQLIADETYLTAEECLAFGLCSHVIKPEEAKQENEAKEEPQANIKETLFNKYRKEIQTEETKEIKNENLLSKFKM